MPDRSELEALVGELREPDFHDPACPFQRHCYCGEDGEAPPHDRVTDALKLKAADVIEALLREQEGQGVSSKSAATEAEALLRGGYERHMDITQALMGPHEWGYRDPVEGGWMDDLAPFAAAELIAFLRESVEALETTNRHWEARHRMRQEAQDELAKSRLSSPSGGGWRPIDSAPKTPMGEAAVAVILGFAPDEEGHVLDSREGFWLPSAECWVSTLDPRWTNCAQPTHWQPLPPPPAETGVSNKAGEA